ncbi:MAG TPA: phenylalanine--tRNA ligase subunit beta [Candidatus Binatia bacterium]|nr:phenylalanine--tRNA ligase subunit beta [Candidatus Binatia bacterium]
MKFTFNWLREFVEFKASPQKLAELLTMAGLEVESLTALREPETDREDWLLEVSVTPNRGDCLGITGLATEVSALTGGRVKSAAATPRTKNSNMANRVSIAIQNSQLCPRYSARVVDEMHMGLSPAWMRFRLEACGIRSINNVVDVTNYVMLETGQPLHAFDLDRLPTRKIVVRPAKEIRKFTTLDGVERELVGEDLLICDGDVPIALAGVMGGTNSEVTTETRSILLESANFDPRSIRRTAKRLGLHSEASHRFERGVDPEGTLGALDRAVYFLATVATGVPVPGVADRYPGRPKPATLFLREERVEAILGVRIGAQQAEKLLRSLGLKTQRQPSRGRIKVVVPTRRADLTREADLIEELARLYGYQNIPSSLPLLRPSGGGSDHRLAWERRTRSFLAGEGLIEVVNLPFITEKLNRVFVGLWDRDSSPVAVLNPIAKESTEMRLSLVPGLIENLRANLAQKAESFGAYHLGKVFRLGHDGTTEERQCLSGVLYGPRARRGLRTGSESSLTFLDCKGLIEGLLDVLHMGDTVTWSKEGGAFLHPGRAAALLCDEKKLGTLGQVHPDVSDELGVPPFLLFELDFEGLLQYAPRRITARSLPRFPSVERDFAIVVEREFPSQQIISWIKNRGEALIEYVEVFDQYLGSPIPAGKKSLAYKISYRADDRTLTDTEVNTLHQSLVDQIAKFFGGEVRS